MARTRKFQKEIDQCNKYWEYFWNGTQGQIRLRRDLTRFQRFWLYLQPQVSILALYHWEQKSDKSRGAAALKPDPFPLKKVPTKFMLKKPFVIPNDDLKYLKAGPLFAEDSYSENSNIYSDVIVKQDISYWAALMRIIKDARTIIGLILGAAGLIKLIV